MLSLESAAFLFPGIFFSSFVPNLYFCAKAVYMIKRIVKLTFREDQTDTFVEIFRSSKSKILARPGCTHLELWRDVKNPNTFFTYSYWESEADLNAYRKSDFFGSVWPRTKSILAAKPEAWSIEVQDV